MSFFDQVATDDKSVLTFEKRPLVAELKLKMSQIALFFHIFDRRSGGRIIKQKAPEGCDFSTMYIYYP